jgi:two-component system cell cycle sensor histidine kinase/response regulator CckA
MHSRVGRWRRAMPRSWPAWQPYLAALAIGLMAWLATAQYAGFLARNFFFVGCFAVMVSVVQGGFGPGVVTALMAAAAVDYYLVAPTGSFAVASLGDRIRLVSFLLGSTIVSAAGGALKRERRRAHQRERALRESEERHRFLLERASDGIFVADTKGRFVQVNSRGADMLGYAREELLGQGITEVIAHQRPAAAPVRWHRLQTEPVLLSEQTLRRKDGSTFPAEISSTLMSDGHVQAIVRDITARRRSEDALRASEAELRALVGALSDVILVLDRDGRVLKIPSALSSRFSHPAQEMLGRTLHDVFGASQADQILGYIHSALRSRQPVETEYPLTIDGREVWFQATVSPMLDDQVVLLARDVTQQKVAERELTQVEHQLRHSQKMEAVGRLAGGIAHDFNNLLTVIRINTDLLLDALAENDPRREGVSEVRRAAERAASLTTQMLAFSRKQVMQPRELDLNVVVHETQKMLRRVIGEHISLVTEPGADPGLVRADPGQLEQVLLNLALNSRDAMPDGGTLRIRTMAVTVGDRPGSENREWSVDMRPGPYVVLEVTDTGFGMDAETQAQVFEPFFTTKPIGQGTGLGLSMVYGIVKQSGGFIQVTSEPGVGTTFLIAFPRLGGVAAVSAPVPAVQPAVAPAAATTAASRNEAVLLVEDEDTVRLLARRILERQGYSVLTARNGLDALDVLERHGAPIDLLVTDVVMPGMNGRELAERLVARQPELRVLYLSGYMDDEVVRRGLTDTRRAFLQKPFTADLLARAVHEVLSRADTRRILHR